MSGSFFDRWDLGSVERHRKTRYSHINHKIKIGITNHGIGIRDVGIKIDGKIHIDQDKFVGKGVGRKVDQNIETFGSRIIILGS